MTGLIFVDAKKKKDHKGKRKEHNAVMAFRLEMVMYSTV